MSLGLFVPTAAVAIWLLPEPLVTWSVGQFPWTSKSTPAELTPKEWSDAVTAARQGVLLAAGGVLAAITLFLSRIRDAIAADKHELDRDANRTDRFTQAVEQLGSEQLAVRLGGIHALGRLGADSQRDCRTIVQVLAAWARANAEVPNGSGPYAEPTDDVSAALSVIAQLMFEADDDFSWLVNLSGRVFGKQWFGETSLDGANLSKSVWAGTDWTEASLVAARMPSGDFSDCSFLDADLSNANLTNAVLSRATLVGANLTDAILHGCDLRDASIERAGLSGADARGANFSGVRRWNPEQLQSLRSWDESTQWPDGYAPPSPTKSRWALVSEAEFDAALAADN